MLVRAKEIVITGGPRSGKTSLVRYLRKELPKHGVRPIICPEAATIIILGVAPDINEIARNDLGKYLGIQRSMLTMHMAMRKEFDFLADAFAGEKMVKIYDRGGMDPKPYTPEGYFEATLRDLRLTLFDVRDSYHTVIFLVSAANGAEKFYNTENNPARRETLDEARTADEKTLQAWIGHPHLKIIDNSTDFKGKLERALKVVLHSLGLPSRAGRLSPLEIEKKFLLGAIPDFTNLAFGYVHQTLIEQIYCRENRRKKIRIRKQSDKDFSTHTYYKTQKTNVAPGIREEFEDFISATEYNRLQALRMQRTGVIKKSRWYFVYKNQYFELDVFLKPGGLCLLEIELIDKDEKIELPPFLEIEKEVTDDPSYSNFAISKRI